MIPPDHAGEFVAGMERVLDACKRPYDENVPLICMDESPKQLIESVQEEIMEPGKGKAC